MIKKIATTLLLAISLGVFAQNENMKTTIIVDNVKHNVYNSITELLNPEWIEKVDVMQSTFVNEATSTIYVQSAYSDSVLFIVNKYLRNENIKVIGEQLKVIESRKPHMDKPLIVINDSVFEYDEYQSGKDTIGHLSQGVIAEISIYSNQCEKEKLKQYNRESDSGAVFIVIK